MKITVYNIKGGVGKTSIALNLALSLKCGVITNDIFSPLETVIGEDNFLKVGSPKQAREDINLLDDFPIIDDNIDVIYDLGGRIETRAIPIIEQSDWVIVPTLCDYIDLQVTVNFINQLEEITNKIIIIANNTVKGDFKKVELMLMEHFDYPIYEIKRSKALPSIFLRKKPLSEIIKEGGLLAHSFRPVEKQFKKVTDKLLRSRHEQSKT